jgi:hypothetical protein
MAGVTGGLLVLKRRGWSVEGWSVIAGSRPVAASAVRITAVSAGSCGRAVGRAGFPGYVETPADALPLGGIKPFAGYVPFGPGCWIGRP